MENPDWRIFGEIGRTSGNMKQRFFRGILSSFRKIRSPAVTIFLKSKSPLNSCGTLFYDFSEQESIFLEVQIKSYRFF